MAAINVSTSGIMNFLIGNNLLKNGENVIGIEAREWTDEYVLWPWGLMSR